MIFTTPTMFLALVMGAPLDPGAQELKYSGSLSKVTRNAESNVVKRVSMHCVVSPVRDGVRQMAFVIDERGAGGWSWPERFGAMTFDESFQAKGTLLPRLLYDHEGTPTVIAVPLPFFENPEKLRAGAMWTQGRDSWEVLRQQKVQNRDCWQVAVSTNFGTRRTLWIDVESPLLVACDERIFIGQGEEHLVSLRLESIGTLSDDQFARVQKPLATLLKLQSELQRTGAETKPELTGTQLKLATDALPSLEKDATDTSLNDLVIAISKDVKSQLQREGEVAKLSGKFVGQTAPPLALKQLDRQPFDAAALKGKIVVLHFWEYQGEPLLEPYGQIGYLDFLYGKRRKLGVEVLGVAVDSRLADQQTAATALRSIQKLKSFMNLGYPLAIDDGTLIGKFGDPRRVGSKLPLWVVIASDGKIAHYHVGYHKFNTDEGLHELDALLVKLIKENKAAE